MTATADQRRTLRPLGWLGMFLYPLLARLKQGREREWLDRRRDLTLQRWLEAKERGALQKQLRQEARAYGIILREQWRRMGGYYAIKWRDEDVDGRSKTRHKIQKVKFRRAVLQPECISFEILIGRRYLFGYKSALPLKVLVKDLIHVDTLQELSDACRRPVTAERGLNGVYVIVHRTKNHARIPELVTFRSMLPHYPAEAGTRGSVIVGVGEHRAPHLIDLERYPHWLIGGASGGGKSNMINNTLCAILRFASPRELKLILVDPKRLELSYYRSAPHLDRPVIYKAEAAIQMLEETLEEVERRTVLMETGARKFTAYNLKHPEDPLPRLVIVIDEVAALMRNSAEAKEVQALITQIANLGRAVGIHLICCTQFPIVEYIPNSVKISMWARIAARVQNSDQSRVILGTGDAASLPDVPGRMVYGKDSYLFEIQTPLVEDEDINEALRIAQGRALGWVKLDGYLPVIDPEPFLDALVHNPLFNRRLIPQRLAEVLAQYAIPRRQVRAFVEDLVRAKTVLVGKEQYRVERHPTGGWMLMPENEAAAWWVQEQRAQVETELERKVGYLKRYPLLPVYAPLYLPAPAEPEPVEQAPSPRPLDELGIYEQFLQTRCVTDWTTWTPATVLHAAYSRFCDELGVMAMRPQKFGKWLKASGFESKRQGKNGSRGWVGLRLMDPPDITEIADMSETEPSEEV